MLYLYLDESGDLGFDFVNKRPSRFFTVCILTIKGMDNNKRLTKCIKTTIKRKFIRKNKIIEELKGSKCPLQIKKYFYSLAESIDFEIYSITLNKIRLFERLRRDKERVYNYLARLVLDKIPFHTANLRVEIIIDKSKSRKEIYEFNQYIVRQIKSKFDPLIPLDIYHYNSKHSLGLQAVDLFSWGLFRKYESKDLEWFDIFKPKVRFDELYLP